MADKSSQLILAALSRAAAAPTGAPLHGSKTAPGLFPNTVAGKQAGQRCLTDGYLCLATGDGPAASRADEGGTATLVKKKTPAHPLCTITEKGLAYLLNQVSPRDVLEDFVRALEARQMQAEELLTAAEQMRQSMEALQASADKVLQHTYRPETTADRGGAAGSLKALFSSFLKEANSTPGTGASPAANPAIPTVSLHAPLLAELTRWQSASTAEDCPLPHLFRHLSPQTPGCTIGLFHDTLRQLHDLGKIYLHPWTGPLYDIPEPPYALLIGHEIAYYASIRK